MYKRIIALSKKIATFGLIAFMATSCSDNKTGTVNNQAEESTNDNSNSAKYDAKDLIGVWNYYEAGDSKQYDMNGFLVFLDGGKFKAEDYYYDRDEKETAATIEVKGTYRISDGKIYYNVNRSDISVYIEDDYADDFDSGYIISQMMKPGYDKILSLQKAKNSSDVDKLVLQDDEGEVTTYER